MSSTRVRRREPSRARPSTKSFQADDRARLAPLSSLPIQSNQYGRLQRVAEAPGVDVEAVRPQEVARIWPRR